MDGWLCSIRGSQFSPSVVGKICAGSRMNEAVSQEQWTLIRHFSVTCAVNNRNRGSLIHCNYTIEIYCMFNILSLISNMPKVSSYLEYIKNNF